MQAQNSEVRIQKSAVGLRCLLAAALMLALAQTACAAVSATGGTITNIGIYKIHTFISNATFTVTAGGTVDVLVVAGGGAGGGGNNGGGGGAGGLLYVTQYTVSAKSYDVSVGAGGVGKSSSGTAASGSNSVFDTITATGGGGGGGNSGGVGGNGGSSGGGGFGGGLAGTRTPSPLQGNNGAPGSAYSAPYTAGGGGGAGAAALAGQGGNGLTNSISGSNVTYAGGGSGGQNSTVIPGGTGGGGNGGATVPSNIAPTAGAANTGGGGGGCQTSSSTGGSGGSGIVIVRYLIDLNLPQVINGVAQQIRATSLQVTGTLSTNGAAAATVYLFCATNDCTTNAAAWAANGSVTNLGTFTTGASLQGTVSGLNLTPGTICFWNLMASNSYGVVWGAEAGSPSYAYNPPGVNNGVGATGVGSTWATLNGNLTTGGTAQITFFWGTDTNNWSGTNVLGSVAQGPFSTNLTGLSPVSATYYYACMASNASGTATSTPTNFTTLPGSWFVAANGSDTAAGTNWGTAFLTVSNALAHVSITTMVVYVQNGTYLLTNQINMVSGCQLLGGYSGTTPEPGLRGVDPATNCIIDGASFCRVFNVSNCASGTLIDGFTIQNGKSSGSGGGLYVYNSTNTISHNKIVANSSPGGQYGGGLYIIQSLVALSNNVIAGNSNGGGGYGGGIYNTASSMSLVNNTIYGNAGSAAGCIYLASGNSIIKNNIIAANTGYGICLAAGTVTLLYNDVWGNVVSNYFGCSPGAGDISRNPLLVGGGDYHEQSQAGSWHGGSWAIDPQHSPCIDAGDSSDYSLEPTPNGSAINMGAYGNTPTASKSIGYIPAPAPRYVRPAAEATPVWPYTNWVMAAGDLQTAINPADGQPVYVKVGTYNITNGAINMYTAQLLGGYLGAGSPGSQTNSPADACILDAKNRNGVFYCMGCATGTVIDGFTIQNGNTTGTSGGGLYVNGNSGLTISHNKLLANSSPGGTYGGGIYIASSTAVGISNNVIAGNSNGGGGYGGGIYALSGIILVNNTIYGNTGSAAGCIYLWGGNSIIKNNIIAANTGYGIYLGAGTVTLSYNDVWGNAVSNYYACAAGTGDISANPMLVGGGDYHEQSRGGSWHDGAWTRDPSNSPCIDAGDPTSNYSLEPSSNGKRINMGAYGGTAQASKTYTPGGTTIWLR